MVYAGRVWLCYTEKEFWNLTPRQFEAQLNVHQDITSQMYGNGSTSGRKMAQQPLGFIDQIRGW